MDCLEILDSITEVYPIPIGTFSCSVPFNVRNVSQLNATSFSKGTTAMATVTDLIASVREHAGMLVEGVYGSSSPANSIEIQPDVSVKNSNKTDITGTNYTVKVTAKTLDRMECLNYFTNTIAQTDFDMFIIDSEENLFLVRGAKHATELSVSASVPRSNGHEIEAEILSVNGIQKIV